MAAWLLTPVPEQIIRHTAVVGIGERGSAYDRAGVGVTHRIDREHVSRLVGYAIGPKVRIRLAPLEIGVPGPVCAHEIEPAVRP